MSSIVVENLRKVYPVSIKEPGLKGTLNHFFNRKYRHVAAVKDVSFAIEPGEVVGFLGPNGAGKTTTLKMLTGLIHPSGGNLSVSGHYPFSREATFLQKITLVMGQKQQLLWDLPAMDSLRINAAVYDIPRQVFRQRLAELTEMLSLQDKLKQPVRKLSLGERMKAELLAALLHQPQVLFLDEPTLGLDVNAQVAVRNFLRDYNQKYGATILLTSHYMADITALCDRVLLIHQGSLFYDGSLDGLLEKFTPCREIRVELAAPFSSEQKEAIATHKPFGELVEIEGLTARFLVQRETLTNTVSKILAELELVDLTVSDPPIEEVIGQVFTSQPSQSNDPSDNDTESESTASSAVK
ncbi:ABC transporter related protein [Thalassoporum mexicanum PCC 7367]|uniref:ABC transporter ATP-binding protein n=1 Tax=Thalassoporum mexicanum TaxID=3457544 RepID=UPI00029FBE79|nr:ATP-binding cassette domain-containing protein [Pseudanabaena sp. PCC 7367]AFY68762.1 ABC transporter related protein [Pseudanabaena sp. PCC 7367]